MPDAFQLSSGFLRVPFANPVILGIRSSPATRAAHHTRSPNAAIRPRHVRDLPLSPRRRLLPNSQRHLESHFDSTGAGPEWSVRQTETAPKSNRTFLGPGLNQPITLTVNKLPSHDYVRISFDLLIVDSWDGSGRTTDAGDVVGPDCFRLAADDRTLLWHTFSTTPHQDSFTTATMFQTYPSPVAGDKCPANTGAAAVNSLGYIRDYSGVAQFPMDAVYHVSMTVPHRARDLRLEFKGYNLQPISHWTDYRMDEGWGVDHVKVQPLTDKDVHPCTPDQARNLLDLATTPGDPGKANDAYLSLLTGGPAVREACLAALRAADCDTSVTDRLAADAESPNPKISARALKRLDLLGGQAEHTLWSLTRPPHSPQVRDAATDMLKELHAPSPNDPTHRKAALASRVLEVLGPAD